ncbi:MAG: glutamate--tRNA ligase [Pseudomonadota bacterium]
MTVRTRFAPSPTGYLHVGGARTALFSWLYARHHGGTFVLRIEDTDLERSTPEAVHAILEGMAWLGLDYDEGPFYQTHRFDRYREVAEGLIRSGHAYRCYCSRERLETLRAEQMARKEKPRYDRHCLGRADTPATPSVVRFLTPAEGQVVVDDQIHGLVTFDNRELDDLVILRPDGSPTYNFTVVVDDVDMRISHVIRGDDHLNNTPRQIHLYQALGVTSPVFAHVPMIHGADGAKLSKRHGAVSVVAYRDEGILPEALLNQLVRLGWSHGDQEIFSLDEMAALFDLSAVNASASVFNTDKLLWLNQHYLQTGEPARIARLLSPHLGRLGIDLSQGPNLVDVITAQQGRAKTLVELAGISAFFYQDFEGYDEASAKKHLKAAARKPLTAIATALRTLDEWTPEAIHQAVSAISEQLGVKMGQVAQPLRVAVTGRAASPGIDVTLWLVGREASLRRIDRTLETILAEV